MTRKKPTRICDCGNEKLERDDGCLRCLTLDGDSIPEAELIWALRVHGAATADMLAERVGLARRTGVFSGLRKLRAAGRLTQWAVDSGGGWDEAWYTLKHTESE